MSSFAPDALDQVEPVAGLERNVDDRQVRLQFGNELQGAGHVGRLAADRQVGQATDADGQRLAHGRVIIDDQHLRGRSVTFCLRHRSAPSRGCR
jgi:hypothetical protein